MTLTTKDESVHWNDNTWYEKLVSYFGVSPSVYYMDDNSFNSYFHKNRAATLLTILLNGAITKRNLILLKELWKTKNLDGYILLDAGQPKTVVLEVMCHEFVHSKQKKSGVFISPIHDLRELEADIISTDFIIKNNINAVVTFDDFKKYINGLPKTKRLLEATAFLRFCIFILIIFYAIESVGII